MKRKHTKGESGVMRTVSLIGRIVFILVLIGLVLVIIGMINVYRAYSKVSANIERIAEIDLPEGSLATRVYGRDYVPATEQGGREQGTLLATLYEENRQLVKYPELPPMLLACVLSTEDAGFFHHGGVDMKGNLRAFYNIVRRHGEVRGGGSTITQQLSRNVFLPYIKSEKTINRKIQEIILAGALEKRFSKQEILEAYLNHIFFGAGAHGIKAAARTYFGKSMDQLTLAECALLAGLPQAPSKYNPQDEAKRELAEARRNEVLRLLDTRLDGDFLPQLIAADPEKFGDLELSHTDIDKALEEPIKVGKQVTSRAMLAPYFVSYVREQVLYHRYEEDQVLKNGLIVVTTLDPQYQKWAEDIVRQKIDEQRSSQRVSQAALILLEAKTGEVLACVGGYQWGSTTSKGADMYNRAFLAQRQVGSAFKPFTYSTAYEQGFPPSLLIKDGPNTEETKRLGKAWPKNSDGGYLGWISMFYALQMSRNAAAVDLMVNCTGIEPVIDIARKMGIRSDLDPVPALTLGSAVIRPIEMAEAFDTFPNMGIHRRFTTVKKVYNQDGILIEVDDSKGAIEKRSNRAISEQTAWIMVQNMQRVVNAGTGTRARVNGVEIAGKTGTCSDFTDAWFVGYSPELVCAVWVGNDDFRVPMRHMFGGMLPAEIFQSLMKKIYTEQREKVGEGEGAVERTSYTPRYAQRKFEKPAGVEFNGFGSAVRGSSLGEGDLASEQAQAGQNTGDGAGNTPGGDGGGGGGDDDGFYDPWVPPTDPQ